MLARWTQHRPQAHHVLKHEQRVHRIHIAVGDVGVCGHPEFERRKGDDGLEVGIASRYCEVGQDVGLASSE
jgi:hypothetical protein